MTDLPVDPAVTPDDAEEPQIAADDAGASGLAERIGRQAENHIVPLESVDNDDD